MESTSQELPVPRADDFERLESLGTGSVGSVYKVRHKVTKDIYALKVISKALVLENELGPQLLAEVSTQSQLSHRNLLQCLGFFEDDRNAYLVLEYAAEGDLLRLLRSSGPLNEPTAAHVFAQIAEGLRYLHSQGHIHRDLKAENVLLGPDLHAKVADFGWCAQAGGRTTFCGTPCMLAPEMFSGASYDGGVDIWALGVVLYEMLTGSSPFSMKGRSLEETCSKIVSKGFDDCCLDKIPIAAHSLLRGLLQHDVAARMSLQEALRHPWVVLQRSRRVVAKGPAANGLLNVVTPMSASPMSAAGPSPTNGADVITGHPSVPSPVYHAAEANATAHENSLASAKPGLAPPNQHKDLRALLEAHEQQSQLPRTSLIAKPVQPCASEEGLRSAGDTSARRAPPSAASIGGRQAILSIGSVDAGQLPPSVDDARLLHSGSHIGGLHAPGSTADERGFQGLPSAGDTSGRRAPPSAESIGGPRVRLSAGSVAAGHLPTSVEAMRLLQSGSSMGLHSADDRSFQAMPSSGDLGSPRENFGFHMPTSSDFAGLFAKGSKPGEQAQREDALSSGDIGGLAPPASACEFHGLNSKFDTPCFSESSMASGAGWRPEDAKIEEERTGWSVDSSPNESADPGAGEFRRLRSLSSSGGAGWRPEDAMIEEERTGWSIDSTPDEPADPGAGEFRGLRSFSSPGGNGWKPVDAKISEEKNWSPKLVPQTADSSDLNEFGMAPDPAGDSDGEQAIRGGYLMSVRDLGPSSEEEYPKPWSGDYKLPQSFLLLTPRWDRPSGAPSTPVNDAPASPSRPQVPLLNLNRVDADAGAKPPSKSLLQPPATSLQIHGSGRLPPTQLQAGRTPVWGPPRTYEKLLLSLFQKVSDEANAAAGRNSLEGRPSIPETGRIVPTADRVPIVMREDTGGPMPKAKVRIKPLKEQSASPNWAGSPLSLGSPMAKSVGQSSPSYHAQHVSAAKPVLEAYPPSPGACGPAATPVANGGYPGRAQGAPVDNPEASPNGCLLRNSLVPAGGLAKVNLNSQPPLVLHIMQLGFTQQQAQAAAKRTSSVEAAVEWLLAQGVGN